MPPKAAPKAAAKPAAKPAASEKPSQATLEKLHQEANFPGKTKFYKFLLQKGYSLTHKDVDAFLKGQDVNVTRKRVTKPEGFAITSPAPLFECQMDLIDYSNIAGSNNGNSWILIVIDIFSRKVWAEGAKNKTAACINTALNKIFSRMDKIPKVIASDSGNEFKGEVAVTLEKKKIQHRTVVATGDHHVLGMVDRVIRTIRTALSKRFEINRSNRWTNILQDVIQNYNNTEHSAIDQTPNDAIKPQNKAKTAAANRERALKQYPKKRAFAVGDTVLIMIPVKSGASIFRKGYEPKFERTRHKITAIEGAYFVLDNDEKYRASQLTKA